LVAPRKREEIAPFRFKPVDGTAEVGLRRIACRELDDTLAMIRARELPPERIVHKVRRSCKAVRGLLRLVRPVFPAYETENSAFREIAASLSHARDGEVLASTLDQLVAGADVALNKASLAALRDRLLSREGACEPVEALLERCVEPLLAARVRAASWFLTEADREDALKPGLRKTYRSARRAMRAAARTGNPHDSYEWRKHVKYHWQHMRLLRALAPEQAKARLEPTDRLGDLLGERHDLDLLETRLTEAAGALPDPETATRLARLAAARAADLTAKAERLGTPLFHEKPSAFVRHWHLDLVGK